MRDITICFTHFKSLTLANFVAALYSVRKQDFLRVHSLVIIDNDTLDSKEAHQHVIDELDFPIPVSLHSEKHGDLKRTHSWSSNRAVACVETPWVFFCRADYLLAFDALYKMLIIVDGKPQRWNGFVTGNGCHLHVGVEEIEKSSWRESGARTLRTFPGIEYDYTKIDSGVWLGRKDSFDQVGGFDESLTAWGHAQTYFQYKLYRLGTEFFRIPEVLFWHTAHGGDKDINLAHTQLRECGQDLKKMWERYEGVSPYKDL